MRVSTSKQETSNQRRELEAVAKRSGWEIVNVYEDAGISEDGADCLIIGNRVALAARRSAAGAGLAKFRALREAFRRRTAPDWRQKFTVIEGGKD